MNPQRSSKVAVALCGTVVLTIWVGGSLVVLSSADVERARTVPAAERRAAGLPAVADGREAAATNNAVVANAEVATPAEPATPIVADTMPAPAKPESTVDAVLPDASQKQSLEAPPVQVATAEPVTQTATTAAPDEPKPIVDAVLPDASQKKRSLETPPVQVATAAEPVTQTATTAAPDEQKPVVEAALPDSPQKQSLEAPPVQAATAAAPVTQTATTAAPDEPKPIVEAALPDSSQRQSLETPPVRLASANTSDPVLNDAKEAVSSIEILDECLVPDICIDRYLWALYQRTPKEDTIKVQEQRKVTVKRKRKTVTVTRTFTKLVDQDFTWKDPKAAERAGMPMMDYVIGGMDRSFKLKLFHALHAAEEAGLSPGITSAFRDDYRQSIASGLKAATDRSYHGGSSRGGYGHGLAADVVSVKGATRAQRWISTESLWKWIDAHGKEFGIGRPYLDRDPPHLAPTDGKEYAAHRGTKDQHAEADVKKRKRLAAQDHHRVMRTALADRRKADKLAAR